MEMADSFFFLTHTQTGRPKFWLSAGQASKRVRGPGGGTRPPPRILPQQDFAKRLACPLLPTFFKGTLRGRANRAEKRAALPNSRPETASFPQTLSTIS